MQLRTISARLAIVILVAVTTSREGRATEEQCVSPYRPPALFIAYSKPNASDDCSTDHIVLHTRSGKNLCVCQNEEWVPSVKTYVE